MLHHTIMENSAEGSLMTCWKQQEILRDRKKKEILLILRCGKMLHRNTSCVGKAPGVKVFRDGILSARPWQQNTLVLNSTFMAVVWTCSSRIMKARLHKVLSAITSRR